MTEDRAHLFGARVYLALNVLLKDDELEPALAALAEPYRAGLSVRLDIESLPLPLRPVAYVTPAWYLESPVYKWTFAD